MVDYNNLDRYFTKPEKISPFFDTTRIPRKLKKQVKKHCGVHWDALNNGQRLWLYLEHENLNYKRFIIKCICEAEEN